MSKPELTWSHNAALRRWEISYHSQLREMLHGDGRVVLDWISDGFTNRINLTREKIQNLVTYEYGAPFPDEAFEQWER